MNQEAFGFSEKLGKPLLVVFVHDIDRLGLLLFGAFGRFKITTLVILVRMKIET